MWKIGKHKRSGKKEKAFPLASTYGLWYCHLRWSSRSVCVCVVVDGVVLWFGFFKGCVVKKERKKNYSNWMLCVHAHSKAISLIPTQCRHASLLWLLLVVSSLLFVVPPWYWSWLAGYAQRRSYISIYRFPRDNSGGVEHGTRFLCGILIIPPIFLFYFFFIFPSSSSKSPPSLLRPHFFFFQRKKKTIESFCVQPFHPRSAPLSCANCLYFD